MKDYSNYYPSSNDTLLSNLRSIFQKRLDSLEGITVDIDNIKNVQVIILEHNNPLNEDKEDRKAMIPCEYIVHRGSLITWNIERWMVVNDITSNDSNGVFYKAKILKCNYTLSHINTLGNIIQTPCIRLISNSTSVLSKGKFITTPDTSLQLYLPRNEETLKLTYDDRFLISHNKLNPSSYKIVKTDDTSMYGIVILNLDSDLTGSVSDNYDLMIANYWNRIASYSVNIKTASSTTINTTVPLQLDTELIKTINGVPSIVLNPIFTYESNIPSVASVGLSTGIIRGIANGNVVIKVSYVDSIGNIVLNTVNINVNATVEDVYSVEIVGVNEIYLGFTENYTANLYKNSILVPSSQFVFAIDASINPTTPLSSYNFVNGSNTCSIKCNAYTYYVSIKAIWVDDNTKTITKTVKLRGF